MAEPEQTTTQKTQLEQNIDALTAQYTRMRTGPSKDKPMTQAGLASFVLGSLLPTLEEIRKEYNEGFEAIGALDLGDDDDDDEDGDDDLLVVAKNILVKLALFNNMVLQHAGFLDEKTGRLLESAPEALREMYDHLASEIAVFDEATKEVDDADGDGDDGDGVEPDNVQAGGAV